MPRNLDPGQNPFRERNPVNARKRQELMGRNRGRLDEIERFMNERQAIKQEEHRRRMQERGY